MAQTRTTKKSKNPRIPANATVLGPQKGPQTLFAQARADIVIYGGAAGGGKTHGLLLEPLRYWNIPGFSAAFFRRTMPQLTNPGSAWDTTLGLYPATGAKPNISDREWKWPCGAKIKLAHLVHETTVHDWHGAQVPVLLFDELTQFTAYQFFYLLSRNRSTCGVRPYIRAACNPDADSWVAEFISWWIDQETGFSIPSRIGKIRYFVRGPNDAVIWSDDKRDPELQKYLPDPSTLPPGAPMPRPKSVTFIPAVIYDNPALLTANPEYLASLLAMPLVERERLLGGNWKIRPAAGLYFKRAWVEVIDAVPAGLKQVVRYWDLAATEKTPGNDPDWTVGVKLGQDEDNFIYVLDVIRDRVGPFEVEQLLKNTASQDGKACKLGWGKDPGQSGKFESAHFARMLSGYWVLPEAEGGDKITRFGPTSAQCKAGNVKVLRGPWNEEFFRVLEGFPELAHDDDVDAFAGAFALLTSEGPGMNMYEIYRQDAAKRAAEEAAKREAQPEPIPARGSVEWDAYVARLLKGE